MAQRRKMDQFASMAHHEGFVVENSDKCGDDCLYLPNTSRLASANQSKYKYRLSLQANVYAGKLYHLCLLLPNLMTGADFGVTSFLAGVSVVHIQCLMHATHACATYSQLPQPSHCLNPRTASTYAHVGLVRMFQLGEVTNRSRKILRGMDGGSENVNFTGLGMNSLLVKELHRGSITCIQQHRLPPDHSHHWLTDGTFSVIEGWCCHDGFAGCATVRI